MQADLASTRNRAKFQQFFHGTNFLFGPCGRSERRINTSATSHEFFSAGVKNSRIGHSTGRELFTRADPQANGSRIAKCDASSRTLASIWKGRDQPTRPPEGSPALSDVAKCRVALNHGTDTTE